MAHARIVGRNPIPCRVGPISHPDDDSRPLHGERIGMPNMKRPSLVCDMPRGHAGPHFDAANELLWELLS